MLNGGRGQAAVYRGEPSRDAWVPTDAVRGGRGPGLPAVI